MRIHPRYDGDPVLVLHDHDPASVLEPLLRQRRRLEQTLATLDADQWSARSRCAEWTTLGVVVHLAVTNRFWAGSIAQARQGSPTRMLAEFDPVGDPPRHVAAVGDPSDAEAAAMLGASTDRLEQALLDMAPEEWLLPAESPLGHVAVMVAAHHALWDAWVHERDIAVPLGLTTPVVDDEVAHTLRFAAGFGPALQTLRHPSGQQERGTVVGTDPETRFSVLASGSQVRVTEQPAPDVPVVVTEDAVVLLEALSVRTPLELPAAAQWLFAGIRGAFDTADPADTES